MRVCAEPLHDDVLADYWLAALPDADVERVELHLLECDACAGRLRAFAALAEGIRRLARAGNLRVVLSDSLLRQAAQEGMRVRSYQVPAWGGVDCTVTAQDDFLIARLAVEVTGAGQVDLCICDAEGVERGRMRDVPARAGLAEIIFNEPIEAARAMGTSVLVVQAVEGERVIGEYTFRHTPS